MFDSVYAMSFQYHGQPIILNGIWLMPNGYDMWANDIIDNHMVCYSNDENGMLELLCKINEILCLAINVGKDEIHYVYKPPITEYTIFTFGFIIKGG